MDAKASSETQFVSKSVVTGHICALSEAEAAHSDDVGTDNIRISAEWLYWR